MRRIAVMVIGSLLLFGVAGCGGSTKKPVAATTTTTTAAPALSTTSTAPLPTSTTVTGIPVGGHVPAGFEVQSASFVSAQRGWVLGTAPCSSAPCTSIARTVDGGKDWLGIPAPRDGLASGQQPQTGVSEVRFADQRDGWLFGPDLWSTRNGGATWSRTAVGPAVDQVRALEVAGGEVDAVVTDCSVNSSPCPAQLWHAPLGSDTFTQVPGVVLPNGIVGQAPLVLHGTSGYLIDNRSTPELPRLWVTTDGTHWTARPTPCIGEGFSLASVAPVDAGHATVLCAGQGAAGSTAKMLYSTSDAGQTYTPVGVSPPREGDSGTVSAASSSTYAIATSSAAAEIYLSVNKGASWTTALQLADGGIGFGDFGFTDTAHGFAVHAPAAHFSTTGAAVGTGPDPATLFLTSNGGVTWVPAAI